MSEQEKEIALDFTELSGFLRDRLNNDFYNTKSRKYDKDQIRRFMLNPRNYERQLREVGLYLKNTSSHFYRINKYLSTMLTFDWLLIPVGVEQDKMQKPSFRREYNKAIKFIESYNIKNEFGKIVETTVDEDLFFGVERKMGNSIVIQRLPSNYCKIVGWNEGGYAFAFDLNYFNNRKQDIDNYSKEIKDAYKTYEKNGGNSWYQLKNNAVAFKLNSTLDYGLPILSGIFEDIIDLEDLKDLIKKREKIENFKLLVQKIPMKKDAKSEKDFLIGLDSVKIFHRNIKDNLPDGVSIVSSPMELEGVSFERSRSSPVNNVSVAEEQVYNSSGVSSALFNSQKSGSIGLNRSLEVDQNMMFGFLRQIEKYLNYRLSKINNGITFKIMFPDLTHFNRKEKSEMYLKVGQYGFPKLLLASSLGIQANDLTSLVDFENHFLELADNLIPLTSSHTSSGEDVGRTKKDEKDLSDKGIEARDTESNDNRAK